MHRQSLGSSGSKLHLAHGVVIVGGSRDESAVVTAAESQKIMTKDQASSSSSLSNNYDEGEEQVRKSIKALNKSLSRAEKYIHLIPVLTFLCFFILYLFSHSPSDKDLAQFQGFEGFTKRIGMYNAHSVSQLTFSIYIFRFSSILPLYSSIHQFNKKKIGSQCVSHTSQMPCPYFVCSNEFSSPFCSEYAESANIDELHRVLEIENPPVLAIRSTRNLQEINRQDAKHRRHRKLADF
ncbi:uncharacterized protein LOC125827205 [Solanum verrucosum]|nr:uncharacterized protein LOC125827205 [Solanum verrucosum]